ncbi:MAG: SufD family Fe-S cluster assembly protein, partial [Planctomycetota bacterium]|nr:SufD family Fe-S cluster assembly protein [Planctomycetota bacterium]
DVYKRQVQKSAEGARNHTTCDSMLVGKRAEARTYPYIDVQRDDAVVEHEASTSRLSEEQLFYLQARGLAEEDAVGLIVNGFAREVLAELPLEFAAEARKLLQLKLENSVG